MSSAPLSLGFWNQGYVLRLGQNTLRMSDSLYMLYPVQASVMPHSGITDWGDERGRARVHGFDAIRALQATCAEQSDTFETRLSFEHPDR